jgi:hypothetical protein
MSDRLFLGTRKGLFRLEPDSKRGWRIAHTAFLGTPISMVLPDPRDGMLYAVVSLGHFGVKLHRSEDGGTTWTEVGVPAYPARPEGAPDEKDMFGRIIPANLREIWALEPGGADRPGRLWAGTIPGGLFRSEDRGATWQLIESLWNEPRRKNWLGGGADAAGIHSVCVDPRDSRRLAVAVSSGGVWHSDDDGASWVSGCEGMRAAYAPPGQEHDPDGQDPHRMVRCPVAPDRVWVQHHNGIFRSDDGGRRWVEIERAGPSTFGFPVAVHPRDPDTAWFVPAQKDEYRVPVDAKVVVTRTRDGGKSFEVLSQGLPSEGAYDLVYRHALDIAADGNQLAFGSTTGSVWSTRDQGDSWRTVSEHLPPVYCVRFG